MSGFKTKILNGTTYDMRHLTNHTMIVQHGQNTYNVGVQYSCHCFTRESMPGDPLDYLYYHDRESRAFDEERYNLSLSLPVYISDLPNHDVYHDARDTFIIIRINGGDYAIFLRIHRADRSADHDVIMRVKTAHLRDDFNIRKPAFKFSRVIHLTANGHSLPKQNKQAIIRI